MKDSTMSVLDAEAASALIDNDNIDMLFRIGVCSEDSQKLRRVGWFRREKSKEGFFCKARIDCNIGVKIRRSCVGLVQERKIRGNHRNFFF